MREPNFSSPPQNRAAVVITSTLYDRRALDCTATLPLVNSLTHLAYMTSTSPRIRDILAADGGLERLVKILATCRHTDKHSLWKWSLAFQCLVNVGVRGTEQIRSRVVEAGAVHVVLAILENFMTALDKAKIEKEYERKQQQQLQQQLQQQPNNPIVTALSLPTMPTIHTNNPALTSNSNTTIITPITASHPSRSTPISTSIPQRYGKEFINNTISTSSNSQQNTDQTHNLLFVIPKRHTFITRTPKPKTKPYTASLSSIPLLNNLSTDAILRHEEDILLSLQLLAYLSKYPLIRQAFHTNHSRNVFSVVEKFTHRIHPAAIVYWAGVIMRNACRKDEARGGVRQCANMQCGKWEQYPREFAKCRRCRKAKYCSKACQSKAWADGHRWWCVERPHTTHPPNPTAASSTTVAAAAAVVAAAPPPTEQVVHFEDTTTSDILPIAIEERLLETAENNTAANPNRDNHRRSSLPIPNDTMSPQTHRTISRPTNEQEILYYHVQRRNSRSVRSLASGSSTEVEADTEATHERTRDLMDVD
ncbi:hypothetical protein BDB01DRAFT_13989 [Pilobolus umbonatus]|nr:hypothetical protein BDB01DRAFT_13989 [Pilobolus umbonatus]